MANLIFESETMCPLWNNIQLRLVNFYMGKARRLYPHRRYFVGFTFVPLLCVVSVVYIWSRIGSDPPEFLGAIIPLSMSVAAWFWGLACMCFWFHPEKGTLFKKSWLQGYFIFVPEEFAVFLTIWFIIIPILLLVSIIRMVFYS